MNEERVTRKTKRGAVKQWLEDHTQYSGDECLEFPFARNWGGYGHMKLDGFRFPHRWMCERVHGETKHIGPLALHSCGNGHLGCVNPKHLYWGTYKDNYHDGVNHGVYEANEARPRKRSCSRLTEKDVLQIREEYQPGVVTMKVLANKYQVDRASISSVIRRNTWKHVGAASSSPPVRETP